MNTRPKLLFSDHYDVTDNIIIRIPSVGEVYEREEEYDSAVNIITAMPIDMMVQLDDIGIDFTKINEYELFIIMFDSLVAMNVNFIFDGIDLSSFHRAVNQETGEIAFIDTEHDIVIDRVVHDKIATALRKIYHIKKDVRKAGNDEAKSYMIERARKKQKRNRNKERDSQIESFIVSMVNAEQFKYKYDEVKDMSIYQFYESVYQIIHKVDYDNRMHGVYAGMVDTKQLSQDDFNWLKHK